MDETSDSETNDLSELDLGKSWLDVSFELELPSQADMDRYHKRVKKCEELFKPRPRTRAERISDPKDFCVVAGKRLFQIFKQSGCQLADGGHLEAFEEHALEYFKLPVSLKRKIESCKYNSELEHVLRKHLGPDGNLKSTATTGVKSRETSRSTATATTSRAAYASRSNKSSTPSIPSKGTRQSKADIVAKLRRGESGLSRGFEQPRLDAVDPSPPVKIDLPEAASMEDERQITVKKKKKSYRKRKTTDPYSIVPLKDRMYEPDQHCGVDNNGSPCTRTITCKHHSVADKRKVPGRNFDVTTLIKSHKETARRLMAAKGRQMKKSAKTSRTRSPSQISDSETESEHSDQKECKQGVSSSHNKRIHLSKVSTHSRIKERGHSNSPETRRSPRIRQASDTRSSPEPRRSPRIRRSPINLRSVGTRGSPEPSRPIATRGSLEASRPIGTRGCPEAGCPIGARGCPEASRPIGTRRSSEAGCPIGTRGSLEDSRHIGTRRSPESCHSPETRPSALPSFSNATTTNTSKMDGSSSSSGSASNVPASEVAALDNAQKKKPEADERSSSAEKRLVTYYIHGESKPMPERLKLHCPLASTSHRSTPTQSSSTDNVKGSTKTSDSKELQNTDPHYFDTSACYYFGLVESTDNFLTDNSLPKTPEPVYHMEEEPNELGAVTQTTMSSSSTDLLERQSMVEPERQAGAEPERVTTSLSASQPEETRDISILSELPITHETEEAEENETITSDEPPQLSPQIYSMRTTSVFSPHLAWLDDSSEPMGSIFQTRNIPRLVLETTLQSQPEPDFSAQGLYEFEGVPDESPEPCAELQKSSYVSYVKLQPPQTAVEPGTVSDSVGESAVAEGHGVPQVLPELWTVSQEASELSAEPQGESNASSQLESALPEVVIGSLEVSADSDEPEVVYDSGKKRNVQSQLETAMEVDNVKDQDEIVPRIPEPLPIMMDYMFFEDIEATNFLEEAISVSLELEESSGLNQNTPLIPQNTQLGRSGSTAYFSSAASQQFQGMPNGSSSYSEPSISSTPLVGHHQRQLPNSTNAETHQTNDTMPILSQNARFSFENQSDLLLSENAEEQESADTSNIPNSNHCYNTSWGTDGGIFSQGFYPQNNEISDLQCPQQSTVSQGSGNISFFGSTPLSSQFQTEIGVSQEIDWSSIFNNTTHASISERSELNFTIPLSIPMLDISPIIIATAEVQLDNDDPLAAVSKDSTAPRKLKFEFDTLVSMDKVLHQVAGYHDEPSLEKDQEGSVPIPSTASPQPNPESEKKNSASTGNDANQSPQQPVTCSSQDVTDESSDENVVKTGSHLSNSASESNQSTQSSESGSQDKELQLKSSPRRGENRHSGRGRRGKVPYSRKRASPEPYVSAQSHELYVNKLLKSISPKAHEESEEAAAERSAKMKHRNWTMPWSSSKEKEEEEAEASANSNNEVLDLDQPELCNSQLENKRDENPSPVQENYDDKIKSPSIPVPPPLSPASVRRDDIELLEMLNEHTSSDSYKRMNEEKKFPADPFKIYQLPGFGYPRKSAAQTTVGMFCQGQADLSGIFSVPANFSGETSSTHSSGLSSCYSSSSSSSAGFPEDPFTSLSNEFIRTSPETDNGICQPSSNSPYGSLHSPFQGPSPLFTAESSPFGTIPAMSSLETYGDFNLNLNEQFTSAVIPTLPESFPNPGYTPFPVASTHVGYNPFPTLNNTAEISNGLSLNMSEGFLEPMSIIPLGNTQAPLPTPVSGIYSPASQQHYTPSVNVNPQVSRGRGKKRAPRNNKGSTKKPAASTVTYYPARPSTFASTEFHTPQLSNTQADPYNLPPCQMYGTYTDWNVTRFQNNMETTGEEYQNTSNLPDMYNLNHSAGNMEISTQSHYSVPVDPSQLLYTGLGLNPEIDGDFTEALLMTNSETPHQGQEQWMESQNLQLSPQVGSFPEKWSNGAMAGQESCNEMDDNFNMTGSQLFQAVLNE